MEAWCIPDKRASEGLSELEDCTWSIFELTLLYIVSSLL